MPARARPRLIPPVRRTAARSALGLLLAACAPAPTPMPTEESVDAAGIDASTEPPLYQLLYAAPLLPQATAEQQRVRMLIWIRRMDFSEAQLASLDELRVLVRERSEQIVRAEQELLAQRGPEEAQLYEALWERMVAGAPADAPEVRELTERLAAFQRGGEREEQLWRLRIEGIRAVFEAEEGFLRTLSPGQEALLAEAVFFLRNRLDPVGNPEDFKALVGTTYDPGQYAVLARGTSRFAREPLNIGGLWSDEPPLAGGALHQAQRRVLLYLALLEPGMDEAIAAARQMLAREVELALGDDLQAGEEGAATDEGADGGADGTPGSAPPGSGPPGSAPPGSASPGSEPPPAGAPEPGQPAPPAAPPAPPG